MKINDFDIRRISGGYQAAGKLSVRFVYEPGLHFSLRTTKQNQPVMKTLECINAPVSAHDGLVSEIFVAVREFLAQEWLGKVDR